MSELRIVPKSTGTQTQRKNLHSKRTINEKSHNAVHEQLVRIAHITLKTTYTTNMNINYQVTLGTLQFWQTHSVKEKVHVDVGRHHFKHWTRGHVSYRSWLSLARSFWSSASSSAWCFSHCTCSASYLEVALCRVCDTASVNTMSNSLCSLPRSTVEQCPFQSMMPQS